MSDVQVLMELKTLLEADIAEFAKSAAEVREGTMLGARYVRGKHDEAERILTWLSQHDRNLFE